MTQSTVAQFLTSFRTSLAARPALAGVDVDLVPAGDTSSIERIILIARRIEGGQERLAMSHVRQDGYRVPGTISAFATNPDSDVAFQEAMTRAGVILDEVVLELEESLPQVGLATLDGLVSDIGYEPYPEDNGGWRCRVDFTVDYTAVVQ